MSTAGHRAPKLDARPLRVYREYGDKQGTVLCVAHRNNHFLLNPGAFGTGEYGGICERCSR